jgi:exopolyphosphatase/guanosine-5'-triphosphate,3'-diphosphate pyrophosphatase
MERVLEECDRAEVSFATDPVHDLRVALRRCRSLADGLMSIDPSQEWKSMKRAGKKVFQSLGELRDVQVMEEWVSRLGDSNDPVGTMMLHYLAGRESELKVHAAGELHDFDRKQWRHWGVTLPRRAAKVRPGSLVFKHLALERWTEAYELHRKALRNGSKIALHSLRIGIKRFRYTVENFLPEEHAAWKDDLKEMQDILGEVHDLDVFWATALQVGVFQDPESRSRWHEKIVSERQARIEKYRAKMLGPKSLWHLWRAALPSGELAAKGAMQRLRLWGSFLDADPKHSTQVTRLALQLFDQLSLKAVNQPEKRHTPREILEVASFLHNANPEKMHPRQKTKRCKPARLIRKMKPPLGWASEDIELVAAVVRHLRGGLPRAGRKSMTALTPPQRKTVAQLAGILRLADAFDFNHDARIQRLRVTPDQNLLIIEAEGYSSRDRMAQALATARHLLETICRRPILIRTLRTAGPSRRSVSPRLHAA